jgi:hypothetical protein
MKRTAGKECEGGSQKHKEVGNERAWVSMFQKQQVVNDFNKTRGPYNSGFQRAKELGLNQAEPVRLSN